MLRHISSMCKLYKNPTCSVLMSFELIPKKFLNLTIAQHTNSKEQIANKCWDISAVYVKLDKNLTCYVLMSFVSIPKTFLNLTIAQYCWYANLRINLMPNLDVSYLKKFQIPRRMISKQATIAITAVLGRKGAWCKPRTDCIHASLSIIFSTCNLFYKTKQNKSTQMNE